MEKFNPNFWLLGVAGLSLGIGLLILWRMGKRDFHNPLAWSLVCWIFVAMFPVLMIFSFFAGTSDVSGQILGFSFTGAFAGYVFIWWFGSRKYIDAVSKDELNRRIDELQSKLDNALIISKSDREILPDGEVFTYQLTANKTKKIELVTGNLVAVEKIDVWVNSENTNMQMASYYDRSISGTIRYYGAEKDPVSCDVVKDIIYEELKENMAGKNSVAPAKVMVTGAGKLEESNGVKKIFHVATVYGTAGHGYRPVSNLAACVKNALDESKNVPDPKPKSILFPIFGTGQAGGELKPIVKELIGTALSYLERHPESSIDSVSFLTLFDNQLAVCRGVLDEYKSKKRLKFM